jgi:glycerophosphoryl diester phosphodiesterase
MPHPSGRPWIVAHRGARLVGAENTIEAFRAAAARGADAVELDVRRSADDALVVIHDAALPGWSRPIVEMTRAQIRSAAPHVADLDAALHACAGMWVDIEVKNAPYEPDWDPEAATTRRVASLVRSMGFEDRTLVTSFDPGAVAAAVDEGIRAGLLVGRSADPVDALATVAGIEMLLPSVSAMSDDAAAAVVTAASARDIEVGVWTVNDAAEMRRLAGAGVGAICTDDPELAARVLKGQQPLR